MAIFHPIININVDKSYCIRKYNNKSARMISEKVHELSADKTGWSTNVLNAIRNIIDTYHYEIPYDIVEPHFTTIKTTNISLGKSISELNRDDLMRRMRETVNNIDSIEGASSTDEVYLTSNNKYSQMDDIKVAHLICLLSALSKQSNKLWVTVYLTIRELRNNIFYFISDNGHIKLSEKSAANINSGITDYIDSMNELIDGKRELPYRM